MTREKIGYGRTTGVGLGVRFCRLWSRAAGWGCALVAAGTVLPPAGGQAPESSEAASEFGVRQPFRGRVVEPGLQGSQIAARPLVGHATSLELDGKGRIFLVESDRLGAGILDIRGAGSLTAGDFRLTTIEERREQLLSDPSFPEGFFTRASERIARLEDVNGDGVPDRRTEFAAGMNDVLDGLAFSALAFDGAVYLTSIPHLWKFVDADDDGVADTRETLLTGFGVRTSMMGHDLHGIIIGPDGRLYWSVGDRGYNVVSREGRRFAEPSRGAVFRSDPDGSNFEVVHHGLRNPQELAFDEKGDLFTFDNTGDIGDLARAVYVLEGADSGWYEEHQAPHQYRSRLDFAELALPEALWVAERMFATRSDGQPQWILPPVANLANGPSGVVYLTGESLPEPLRETFLFCNYRGDPAASELLSVRILPEGAGFRLGEVRQVMAGVAASDVALGYDGRIYVLDFGGGWGLNENASIQVLESPGDLERPSVAATRELFAGGFGALEPGRLADLLSHPDMRVRQRSQFALVRRGESRILLDALGDSSAPVTRRLHGLWGIGQLARSDASLADVLARFCGDEDPDIRANAIRTLGDLGEAARPVLGVVRAGLADPSPKVRSLAAIALGRVGEPAEAPAVWDLVAANAGSDIVIRHACLTALERFGDAEGALAREEAEDGESRLAAVVLLRRLDDARVEAFLDDADPVVRDEAVRTIYDRHLREALPALAALAPEASGFADTLQRRILFANYWVGDPDNAANVLAMAADEGIDPRVRETALRALLRWDDPPTMDPVTAFYRPVERREVGLLAALREPLQEMVAGSEGDALALSLELAGRIGLPLSPELLLRQALEEKLSARVRVAALQALADQEPDAVPDLLGKLADAPDAEVRAAALELRFRVGLPDRLPAAETAILGRDDVPVVRTALRLLASEPGGRPLLARAFRERETLLAPETRLDALLALQSADDADLRTLAGEFAADPKNVQALMLHGGDRAAGEIVFRNQGACLQCHMIGGEGGVQGPALDDVGRRLDRPRILQSLVDPNAEISEGFGLFMVTTKSGESLAGRLGAEADGRLEIILPTEEKRSIAVADIAGRAGPFSAMPPLALALPPADVRDLVAFLAAQRARLPRDQH